MQMSESYAATIAAVVPVIWLVGAVKVQQFVKIAASSARQLEDASRLGEQLLAEVGGHPSLEVLTSVSIQMSAQTDRGYEELRAFPPLPLAYFWTICVGTLLGAEALSLCWLGINGGPNPGIAWFCPISTLIGFGAITVVPALYAYRQMTQSIRAGKQRHTAVRAAISQRLDEIRTEHGGMSEAPPGRGR
ncbi:hypothetical protein ACFVXE_11850 [Streptomyces sp. NPDC058231]|uniref:hypothetical protein n=1 Tax=Streptomyces sp. NPDC058231 TaxID=3346392 RepID=UPI0036E4FA36